MISLKFYQSLITRCCFCIVYTFFARMILLVIEGIILKIGLTDLDGPGFESRFVDAIELSLEHKVLHIISKVVDALFLNCEL